MGSVLSVWTERDPSGRAVVPQEVVREGQTSLFDSIQHQSLAVDATHRVGETNCTFMMPTYSRIRFPSTMSAFVNCGVEQMTP